MLGSLNDWMMMSDRKYEWGRDWFSIAILWVTIPLISIALLLALLALAYYGTPAQP